MKDQVLEKNKIPFRALEVGIVLKLGIEMDWVNPGRPGKLRKSSKTRVEVS